MIVHQPGRGLSGGGFSSAPLDFREKSEIPDAVLSILTKNDEEDEKKVEKVMRCKQCDAAITRVKDRISRAEKHLHTFFNPAGIVYEIGCFRRAPGCNVDGQRSTDFSWFADYSWQISFCASCSKHLGWFFSGGDDSFFGLVVDRLRES